MRQVSLVHRGEGWTETVPAFLLNDRTVVEFDSDLHELHIFKFSISLANLQAIDFLPEEHYVIHFDANMKWHRLDLTKSLAELIIELTEGK